MLVFKIKKYLLLCLIFLQIVAPFIHAHAFGLDGSKQPSLHIHSSEVSAINFNKNSASKSYIGTQQAVGAVFTVSSGNKVSDTDDLENYQAMVAILFALGCLIFGGLTHFIPRHFLVSYQLQPHYLLQNPRAPPR